MTRKCGMTRCHCRTPDPLEFPQGAESVPLTLLRYRQLPSQFPIVRGQRTARTRTEHFEWAPLCSERSSNSRLLQQIAKKGSPPGKQVPNHRGPTKPFRRADLGMPEDVHSFSSFVRRECAQTPNVDDNVRKRCMKRRPAANSRRLLLESPYRHRQIEEATVDARSLSVGRCSSKVVVLSFVTNNLRGKALLFHLAPVNHNM